MDLTLFILANIALIGLACGGVLFWVLMLEPMTRRVFNRVELWWRGPCHRTVWVNRETLPFTLEGLWEGEAPPGALRVTVDRWDGRAEPGRGEVLYSFDGYRDGPWLDDDGRRILDSGHENRVRHWRQFKRVYRPFSPKDLLEVSA